MSRKGLIREEVNRMQGTWWEMAGEFIAKQKHPDSDVCSETSPVLAFILLIWFALCLQTNRKQLMSLKTRWQEAFQLTSWSSPQNKGAARDRAHVKIWYSG